MAAWFHGYISLGALRKQTPSSPQKMFVSFLVFLLINPWGSHAHILYTLGCGADFFETLSSSLAG